jgi:cell division protein FtsW (lipid II flippase)
MKLAPVVMGVGALVTIVAVLSYKLQQKWWAFLVLWGGLILLVFGVYLSANKL